MLWRPSAPSPGQFVNDLTKDDFVLSENKRPEDIRYFSRESDLPLTIGLLVDTSLSQTKVLEGGAGGELRFRGSGACARARTRCSSLSSIWR